MNHFMARMVLNRRIEGSLLLMMGHLVRVLRPVALSSALLLLSASASAQTAPAAPATPSSAPAANGEYVAPLSQTTQPSYVPQSVAMSGPAVMDWDPDSGRQPPAGYHPDTRIRKGLVIAGAVTFGSMYLLTAITAAAINDSNTSRYSSDYYGTSTSSAPPAGLLYIPVVGPFAYLPHAGSQSASVMLVIDGVAQAAGMAMLIGGLAVPKHVLVRNDLAKIELMPLVSPGQSGMGLVGTF